jgi:class 3 adenylate cyclase
MTATGLVCGSCGIELPPNSKFCSQCGAPVATATTPAEYKQVTVLFADVVHSMDIAAAVGAERLREIITELVSRVTAVVRRYGGTVDKFTGDGIMAVFGAPVALEDHALRGCLAALGIHDEAKRLAVEVDRRDGVTLQLRVGLNSGQVIAGEIGSAAAGYTALGEQVGMAQRMESVAPPGGVMLSASTGRLVEDAAVLAEPQMVRIKGAEDAVPARRLLGEAPQRRMDGAESTFVGRQWEMSALAGILGQAISGNGRVVGVVGPPGIGKSRIVGETAALAVRQGVAVFTTYCESHTTDVAFRAVAGLLRVALGTGELDDVAARDQVHGRLADADSEDLLLLDDLLGIADPDVALPQIDPDARRRRVTALLNTASLARSTPAVYVIEDAHWIDEASESMLADFVAVVPQTRSLMLITYRPEYEGVLAHTQRSQTIALEPLEDSQIAALAAELLGRHPSVTGVADIIAKRAAGNPFFAGEIVRDLAERGVLGGQRGAYVCDSELADVSVPATLQAAIAARIDRLDPLAKRTVCAAAVIGSRFSPELLAALQIEPVLDDLLRAELIDQIVFTPRAEYAFRHPLIRAVAYQSQLTSDRAQTHRRLAAAIEAHEPRSADQNAALIAEHLEAAGDARAAYRWHMRAATWATNRDIAAARLSWERATKIADALPADDPDRAAMRIAPRTMLCGIAWRVHMSVAGARFDELRELCAAADDKASLAIATAGLVIDHAFQDRTREASRLASEHIALIESIGDPTLIVGLSLAAIYAKMSSGEVCDVLRWSQQVIDLADGDPSKGNLIFGSPLAVAFATRAFARYCLGRPGWRDDLRDGLAMARSADPASYATVVTYVYNGAIPAGVLSPEDRAVREIEDAVQIAERSGDNFALTVARMTLGHALVHRHTGAERDRGQKLLNEVSDMFLRRGQNLSELQMISGYLARERARRGDHDGAIPLMRATVDHLFREGQPLVWGTVATGVLVETLLDRGAQNDVAEAEAAIERSAAAPADGGLVIQEIWLLRLRTLLAHARGDETGYRDYRDRYRAMATSLGFKGHMEWAEAMP